MDARQRLLVVVIDDFADAADALAGLLESYAVEVLVAYSGNDGLRLMQEVRPHAAVVDILMPDLDGREVARAVRRVSWGVDMTLVALTGLDIQSHSASILDAGFDQCLLKPAKIDELIELLRSHASVAAASTSPPSL